MPKPKAEGEEGEEQEEEPPEDGEEKKPLFKIEDYKWTVTDKKPRNFPQLFLAAKGQSAQHEVRTSEQYSTSQYEAISKCLDEFVTRVIEKNQVITSHQYT